MYASIYMHCGWRRWDTDGNGTISRYEFVKAMAVIGFQMVPTEVESAFYTVPIWTYSMPMPINAYQCLSMPICHMPMPMRP